MARNPLIHQMMNSGNPRQRNLARQLARGRTRGLSFELQAAIETAGRVQRQMDKLKKDGGSGGAGPATGAPVVGTDVYTPTAGSGRRRR